MPFPRLPRYKRVLPATPLNPTPRDREIIALVHKHRFLRSSHLRALLGGGAQGVTRRLQTLYHHGFLERPRSQIDYFGKGGSRSIAHGLGNKGAALLRGLGFSPHPSRAGPGSRAVGRLFLEHALLVSDIMVGLELACRRGGQATLIPPAEFPIRATSATRGWRVDLPGHPRLGIVPDKVFALASTATSEGNPPALCFLEADRGTMPVRRRGLGQTSMWRKLLAYEATWSQGLPSRRFGFGRFRVLVVTRSKARLEHLLEACAALPRGRGLFLLIDKETLLQSGDFLSAPWRDGRGHPASLLP